MDKRKLNPDVGQSMPVKMLDTMFRIRIFEERSKKLYTRNKIFGALHLSVGQEAVAVGVCTSLQKEDYVLSSHRGHGHSIAKGAEFKYMLAELMGKATGYSGGHGGSMHIFSQEIGLLGGNGIVGGGLPIAVGVGHSIKYRNSGQVAAVFFGDGAANTGAFHESLNMAAIWKLPVVYVCENNVYAATTRAKDVTAGPGIAQRAGSYGIPGHAVDGNNVEEVYEVAKSAIERARSGQGPSLIECKTYRIENHCMVLMQPKPAQELDRWKALDPIEGYAHKLINEGILSQNEFQALKDAAESELDQAEEFALKSPWPDPEEMYKNAMV